MNRLTPLLLLAAVALLGYLAYRQAQDEAAHPPFTVEPLFAGVDPARIRAFRIENLERAIHARIERDERSVWYLTDPIAYVAAPEVVEQLLEVVRGNLAAPVPESEADLAAVGLAPPRAFLEVEEELASGETRKTRVDVGAVDLDGQRIYVRRDGEVLRTSRNLETVLQRDTPELRSRRLFRVDPRSIVEVLREGRVYLDGSAPSVELAAQAEGPGWRMFRPVRALADAEIMAGWSTALAAMQVARFVTDLPDADLSRYGLDPPWFRITLRDRYGSEAAVDFGHTEGGTAYAKLPSLPHVFLIEGRDWNLTIEPFEEKLEREFYRIRRDQLARIEIARPDGATRLTRRTDGSFTVAELPRGEAEFGPATEAESTAVDDLLARLERAKVLTYLLDRDPEDVLLEPAERHAIWITAHETVAGGRRSGGWVGPEVSAPDGTLVRAFVREHENVVAGLDPSIAEVVALDSLDFLRRIVWDVTEAQLAELSLSHGGRTRRWLRGEGFAWRPEDAEVEAKDLRRHLDSIFFLKAAEEVRPAERAELADAVEIVLVDAAGERRRAVIGKGADGSVQLTHGARHAVAGDPALHEALKALVHGG